MVPKKYNHDRIDIFFLLNENKIVTQSELRKLLPKENYVEYIKGFYKRRLIDFFQKNYEFPWFIDRYLKNQKKFKVNNFLFDVEYVIINGLCVEDDLSIFKEYKMFLKDNYKISILIKKSLFENDINFEEVKRFYEHIHLNFKTLVTSDIHSDENQEMADKLSKFYNVNLSDFNTKNLCKNVFLFCTNCNMEFNSPEEFMLRCKNECKNKTSKRRLEIIKNYNDFSFIKDVPINFLLKSNIIKIDESIYKCAYCEKKFESVNFIELHYKKKHADELEKRNNIYNSFLLFIDNLDFQVLSIVDGSFDDIPFFVKNLDEKRVVYDMNHVFSGEIVLD